MRVRSFLLSIVSFLCLCHDALDVLSSSVRVVSKDELASKDGTDNGDIWLSMMGKVYDVSAGKQFYGEGGPYSVFAGKDASYSYITGIFTEEEAAKKLSDLEPAKLLGLDHWVQFYDKQEKYPYVGLLDGDLYDKDGNPTDELNKVNDLLKEARAEAEEREKARQERIKKRKRKKSSEL